MSMTDIENRALAAYYRTGYQPKQHSYTATVEHNGLTYVTIYNTYELLAVYRVRNDGVLKRLKRWPSALDES